MEKKKLFICLICLSALMCGSGSLMLAMPETSVTNNFTTGIVDIELDEYQMKDGKEGPYADAEDILPGQAISKIPRIHNAGNDCYVRAKLTLQGTEQDIGVFGMGEDWEKAEDGYFYYREILKTGEDTDLFQGIRIPEDFSQEEEGGTFSLRIGVDAIQSQNFRPDFGSDSPWGDVEIQECEKEGQYDISTFKKADSQSLQVTYQGGADKLAADPDDFFADFPVLLPGDSYSDAAEIRNEGDSPIKLYFRSEAEDGGLLDKIQLTITSRIGGDTRMVYEGPIRADSLKASHLLGEIPAHGTGDFIFGISVPAELDNQYTVMEDKVKWVFSTEPIKENLFEVRTGDARRTGRFLLISGCALGAGTLLLRRRGHGKVRKNSL